LRRATVPGTGAGRDTLSVPSQGDRDLSLDAAWYSGCSDRLTLCAVDCATSWMLGGSIDHERRALVISVNTKVKKPNTFFKKHFNNRKPFVATANV